MISPNKLKEVQKIALAAVAEMTDGELKTKAFEVFLQHLLNLESATTSQKDLRVTEKVLSSKKKSSRQPGTVKSRILLLKDEKYFEVPRIISDVRKELTAHGWIHPNTALSGALQSLVRERELRRIKDKIWKYVNP